jgi:hypothetical protein
VRRGAAGIGLVPSRAGRRPERENPPTSAGARRIRSSRQLDRGRWHRASLRQGGAPSWEGASDGKRGGPSWCFFLKNSGEHLTCLLTFATLETIRGTNDQAARCGRAIPSDRSQRVGSLPPLAGRCSRVAGCAGRINFGTVRPFAGYTKRQPDWLENYE